MQHTATHWDTLQHTTTHCNSLQHTATHCNTDTQLERPGTASCITLLKTILTMRVKRHMANISMTVHIHIYVYVYIHMHWLYLCTWIKNSFLCITHLKMRLTACAASLTAHISMTLHIHIHMYIDSIYVPRKKLFFMWYTSENDTYRVCSTSPAKYLNDATHTHTCVCTLTSFDSINMHIDYFYVLRTRERVLQGGKDKHEP